MESVGGEEAGGEEAFAGLEGADCARALVFSIVSRGGNGWCLLSARIEEISASRSESMIDVFVWVMVVLSRIYK